MLSGLCARERACGRAAGFSLWAAATHVHHRDLGHVPAADVLVEGRRTIEHFLHSATHTQDASAPHHTAARAAVRWQYTRTSGARRRRRVRAIGTVCQGEGVWASGGVLSRWAAATHHHRRGLGDVPAANVLVEGRRAHEHALHSATHTQDASAPHHTAARAAVRWQCTRTSGARRRRRVGAVGTVCERGRGRAAGFSLGGGDSLPCSWPGRRPSC